MVKILHYGLRRSGTNYTQQLLLKNFKHIKFINNNDRKTSRHKHYWLYKKNIHTLQQFQQLLKVKPDFYIVIYKDPFAWLVSYRQVPPKLGKGAEEMVDRYTDFYMCWYDIYKSAPEKVELVRYESLLLNLEMELNKIKNKFNLVRKKKLINPKSVPMSKPFNKGRLKYYLEREYLTKHKNYLDKFPKFNKKIIELFEYKNEI